jgi:hypothetical protein
MMMASMNLNLVKIRHYFVIVLKNPSYPLNQATEPFLNTLTTGLEIREGVKSMYLYVFTSFDFLCKVN